MLAVLAIVCGCSSIAMPFRMNRWMLYYYFMGYIYIPEHYYHIIIILPFIHLFKLRHYFITHPHSPTFFFSPPPSLSLIIWSSRQAAADDEKKNRIKRGKRIVYRHSQTQLKSMSTTETQLRRRMSGIQREKEKKRGNNNNGSTDWVAVAMYMILPHKIFPEKK